MFGNEEAFQESLEAFVEYAESDLYKPEEREYKENLVEILGDALTDNAIASPDFLPRLREAYRRCNNAISNLTHYTQYDDFKNYLDAAPEERIRNLF